MARRGPVADWPKPEKGANPTAARKARRERTREERLPGRCAVCERETLKDAHLCSRCWALVPHEIREHARAAGFLLSFGNPVREEYGRVDRLHLDPATELPPGTGYVLQQTLERRHRTALIACEIAARIFGAGGGEQ